MERITGIPEAQLLEAARLLGTAATAMILTARGSEQQSHGVDNVLSFINLALALGKAGRPHCGYGCLTGQGNGQGGREHGQKADQLPGYRRIDNPRASRAHRQGVGRCARRICRAPDAPPMRCSTSLEPRAVSARCLSSAPIWRCPHRRLGQIEKRLDALDFLVVSDFFLSETAERADVVLPSAQWAEEEGTMTNLEGRVLYRRRALAPPPGVRTDLEILSGLADRLGSGSFFSSEPQHCFSRTAPRVRRRRGRLCRHHL